MIRCDQLERLLEEVGREATGGREELTLRDVVDQLGTAETARQLGTNPQTGRPYTQRTVQRALHERGEINPQTGREYQARQLGPRSRVAFRELSTRELRRAGARALREHGLVLSGQFALCYRGRQQGDERELPSDLYIDELEWLDVYESGDCNSAARMLTDAMLAEYGVDAGDVDVCDEDGGEGLSASAVQ